MSVVAPASATSHSADVQLVLKVGTKIYELGQIGPDAVFFASETELPPCDAEVIMTIDGREHRRQVTLPEGANPQSRSARVTNL